MSKPEVTIGISFRDPGPDLVLAVKSIFAQDFPDWELILVDDGSSDNSIEFTRSIIDDRVRVYSDGRGKTLPVRLNEIIRAARGKYFFRMDADDLMHPSRVRKQLSRLMTEPESVIGTWAWAIDTKSRVTGLRRASTRQKSGLAARHSFIHQTVAASTEWFHRQLYSEHPVYYRSEDAELWCRTSPISRFLCLSEPLMFIREVGTFSLTKHIGTSLGVLNLANDYSRSPLRRGSALSRELAKIWLMCMLDNAGRTDWVIRRRATDASADDIELAAGIIRQIESQELPISSGAFTMSRASGLK